MHKSVRGRAYGGLTSTCRDLCTHSPEKKALAKWVHTHPCESYIDIVTFFAAQTRVCTPHPDRRALARDDRLHTRPCESSMCIVTLFHSSQAEHCELGLLEVESPLFCHFKCFRQYSVGSRVGTTVYWRVFDSGRTFMEVCRAAKLNTTLSVSGRTE